MRFFTPALANWSKIWTRVGATVLIAVLAALFVSVYTVERMTREPQAKAVLTRMMEDPYREAIVEAARNNDGLIVVNRDLVFIDGVAVTDVQRDGLTVTVDRLVEERADELYRTGMVADSGNRIHTGLPRFMMNQLSEAQNSRARTAVTVLGLALALTLIVGIVSAIGSPAAYFAVPGGGLLGGFFLMQMIDTIVVRMLDRTHPDGNFFQTAIHVSRGDIARYFFIAGLGLVLASVILEQLLNLRRRSRGEGVYSPAFQLALANGGVIANADNLVDGMLLGSGLQLRRVKRVPRPAFPDEPAAQLAPEAENDLDETFDVNALFDGGLDDWADDERAPREAPTAPPRRRTEPLRANRPPAAPEPKAPPEPEPTFSPPTSLPAMDSRDLESAELLRSIGQPDLADELAASAQAAALAARNLSTATEEARAHQEEAERAAALAAEVAELAADAETRAESARRAAATAQQARLEAIAAEQRAEAAAEADRRRKAEAEERARLEAEATERAAAEAAAEVLERERIAAEARRAEAAAQAEARLHALDQLVRDAELAAEHERQQRAEAHRQLAEQAAAAAAAEAELQPQPAALDDGTPLADALRSRRRDALERTEAANRAEAARLAEEHERARAAELAEAAARAEAEAAADRAQAEAEARRVASLAAEAERAAAEEEAEAELRREAERTLRAEAEAEDAAERQRVAEFERVAREQAEDAARRAADEARRDRQRKFAAAQAAARAELERQAAASAQEAAAALDRARRAEAAALVEAQELAAAREARDLAASRAVEQAREDAERRRVLDAERAARVADAAAATRRTEAERRAAQYLPTELPDGSTLGDELRRRVRSAKEAEAAAAAENDGLQAEWETDEADEADEADDELPWRLEDDDPASGVVPVVTAQSDDPAVTPPARRPARLSDGTDLGTALRERLAANRDDE